MFEAIKKFLKSVTLTPEEKLYLRHGSAAAAYGPYNVHPYGQARKLFEDFGEVDRIEVWTTGRIDVTFMDGDVVTWRME